jgi:Ca2+-transporting ATPase
MIYQNDYCCSRRTSHIFNLKKAIRYIVSIHIPIILPCPTLIFRLDLPDIFTPVIFLELVMGPMCSIVYENEPAETACKTRPRPGSTFLSLKELGISIVQGMDYHRIFFVYQWTVQNGANEQLTRTMVYLPL